MPTNKKNNKKAANKGQKSPSKQCKVLDQNYTTESPRRRSIHSNLSRANSCMNPLEQYKISPLFTNFDIPAMENDKSNLNIEFYASPLSQNLLEKILHLFSQNMSSMYQQSNWGLDINEKREELSHPDARFLIASIKSSSSSKAITITNTNSKDTVPIEQDIVAFTHFRFEVDNDDNPQCEVMYVYEIQIAQNIQRCGLGKRLMNIMELIAVNTNMKRVMLTVFKHNTTAMKFYTQKLKYVVDESSPSMYKCDDGADYEILSKITCSL